MLALTQLIGFAAWKLPPPPPPSVSFLQLTEDPADLTNYSFAGVNFGAADVTRRIICAVHFGRSTGATTISSATIGGVAATIHVNLSGTQHGLGIISALVPTGTSGTVTVNLTGASDRCAIGTYRAVNETSSSPHATASDTSVTSGLLSTTIDVPANGWVIAGAARTQAGATFTATGFTDAYNSYWAEAAGVARHGGFASGLAAQTGRTISSLSSNTGAQNGNLGVISWG
jgi:hypothetical protein